MGMDFHAKGANFARQTAADILEEVRRMIGGISATIAAQKDGVLQSDQHRALNFQGGGVVVSDDPLMRRANIFIPGSPTASSSPTLLSSVSAVALSLWNVSTNNPPPANWQTPAFNDTAWPAAVVANTQANPPYDTPIAGSSPISAFADPPANTAQALIRHHFTLGAGSIASASLSMRVDDEVQEVYLNGTLISITVVYSTAIPTISLSPSLFVVGDNVLAVRFRSMTPTKMWLDYSLATTLSSAGADTRYQLLAEKNVANGYAGLDAGVRVPTARLGTGAASGSNFLRGDQTWAPASTNSVVVQAVSGTPSVAATTIRFPNATLVDNGGGTVTYTPIAPGTNPYVKVADQKASTTEGGTFTTGAWQTRTLNTKVRDAASIATLSANQVSLPAGTYQFRAVAPAFDVGRHQLRLQNITDAVTVDIGPIAYEAAPNIACTLTEVSGEFTIAATKAFELQHRCELTRATNGFGLAGSWGTEVFAVVEFWKIS